MTNPLNAMESLGEFRTSFFFSLFSSLCVSFSVFLRVFLLRVSLLFDVWGVGTTNFIVVVGGCEFHVVPMSLSCFRVSRGAETNTRSFIYRRFCQRWGHRRADLSFCFCLAFTFTCIAKIRGLTVARLRTVDAGVETWSHTLVERAASLLGFPQTLYLAGALITGYHL